MQKKTEKRFSFIKSALFIALSICLVTGIPAAGWMCWKFYVKSQQENPRYLITKVLVRAQGRYPLDEKYILELCHIPKLQPLHAYKLSTQWMEKQLKRSPWIQSASVQKEGDDQLIITYQNRYPILKIANQRNMALGNDLTLIPYHSCFASLEMPTLILPAEWQGVFGEGMNVEIVQTTLEILDELKQDKVVVIDLRGVFAKSYGKKEVIIQIKSHQKTLTLRLNAYHYMEGLAKYHRIQKEHPGRWAIYDLRVSQLAFVR